jgi:hypothetical protein
MTAPGEIRKLSEEIRKSSELLTVLGDEMRASSGCAEKERIITTILTRMQKR